MSDLDDYLAKVDELLGVISKKEQPPAIPGQQAFNFAAVGTLKNPRLR